MPDWAGAVLLLIAVVATLATVLLLDQMPAEGGYVTILTLAGCAGAAAACIAVLPRPRRDSAAQDDRLRQFVLFALVPPVAGFAAGTFSLLLALALLLPPDRFPPPDSAAVYGGLFGLLLGGWIREILTSQGFGAAAAGVQSSVSTLVHSSASASSAPPLNVQYRGQVGANFRRIQGVELVKGVIAVAFIPEVEKEDSRAFEALAQVLVEDGQEAEMAEFLVTVVAGSDVDSLPRSRIVKVPTGARSNEFEFTVIERSTDESIEPETTTKSSLLLDVSQAGRTVALLPITLGLGSESTESMQQAQSTND